MVEFNFTGYTGADEDLLTGAQLNALADGAGALGETITPAEAGSDFYMDVELTLAQVDISLSTNPSVALYLLKAIDGATFSDTRTSASTLVMVIDVDDTDAPHIEVRGPIVIPPGSWKTYLVNNTGQAFTADDNNHLVCRFYSEESN